MNKELIIKKAKEKFTGELLDVVLKQIDTYFELKDSTYQVNHNYKINDQVVLNKNNLLHGIGKHIDLIEMFSKRGITSPDFFDTSINHAFSYTAAFWNVKGEISLQEYIENYSGIVAKVNDEYWQVPYKHLDEFVEVLKDVDHWSWTAESSMEIRFMPSLAKNNNQVAFIVNTEHELTQRLRQNSVFKEPFNKEYAYEFLTNNSNSKEKFLKEGFKEDFFLRADYLIFGLPANTIEGILVGREVENNQQHLTTLKTLFPNCYICNLDGKVIKE